MCFRDVLYDAQLLN